MTETISLAPVWFSDVVGSALMILLSFLCVWYAARLKATEPSGVIWTYLLVLSLALAGFSISRAVGHLAKHLLLLSGHADVWFFCRPYTGAINSIAFVVVAAVTVFFQRVQKINAQILNDKEALEKATREVMRLNRDLESLVEERTEQLSISEKKYRGIFEGSMDMIFVLDSERHFEDVNAAALEALGFESHEELIPSVHFAEVFADQSEHEELVGDLEEAGAVRDRECRLMHRNGSEVLILLSVTATRDDAGRIKGYEGIAKDITSRRRMERQLQQADRLASLGQTAAGVAHELNTPLGVILGYCQLLLRSCGDEDGARQDLMIIEKQTKNCKRIVEDLLKFARDSETSKSSVDLQHCFNEVISLLGHQFGKEGVTVEGDFDPALPHIPADGEKLKQVLVNLLVNARQAISGHGRISVSAGIDESTREIRVSVSDTGCGISPKVIDRIFDPFFTTKPVGEGTGLGLSVSYGIIQDHGGRIEVQSREGEGSTFTIILPLPDAGESDTPCRPQSKVTAE
jgi:PAS domain S-box-containing protein